MSKSTENNTFFLQRKNLLENQMEYFSFRKPWNGYSTTVVNVDTHERKEWTDTEDAASVKINQAPYFQNRTASNPNLSHQGADSEPFNYIAFSQQLYGEKNPGKQNPPPKQRAVSYV